MLHSFQVLEFHIFSLFYGKKVQVLRLIADDFQIFDKSKISANCCTSLSLIIRSQKA